MKKLEKIIMITGFVMGVSLFAFGEYKTSNTLKISGLIIGTAGAGIAIRPLIKDYNKKKKY